MHWSLAGNYLSGNFFDRSFNFTQLPSKMSRNLIFNYVSKDGGVILSDLKGDFVKTLSMERVFANQPLTDGQELDIASNLKEMTVDAYARYREMWHHKIDFMRRLGHYRSTGTELPGSAIGERIRVVGTSPLEDKVVVSKLLFQELADQKTKKRIGSEEGDSRLFLELTIERENSELPHPPMIVLEVIEGGDEMTFLNDQSDYNQQPTDNQFENWNKDICTFVPVPGNHFGEYKFLYSARLPEWVYRLIKPSHRLIPFRRGDANRALMNMRLVKIDFIDHLPYINHASVYVLPAGSSEFRTDSGMEEDVHRKLTSKNAQSSLAGEGDSPWLCGNCTFHNPKGLTCQMCGAGLEEKGEIMCRDCDFDEVVWIPPRPEERAFVCEMCGYRKAFCERPTDSNQLFHHRELSCFNTGMVFRDSDFSILIGSLSTFLEPSFEVPVAIVPPDVVQEQLGHTGVSIRSAELNRIYYQTMDPVESYHNAEYQYYTLLSQSVDLIRGIAPEADELDPGLRDEIRNIEARLDRLDQQSLNQNGCIYRRALKEHYHRSWEQLATLDQMAQIRIESVRDQLKGFDQLVQEIGSSSHPAIFDTPFWREPVNPRLKTVTRLDLLGVYLHLAVSTCDEKNASRLKEVNGEGLSLASFPAEKLVLVSELTKAFNGEIINSIDRFGGNPNHLKKSSGAVMARILEKCRSSPDDDLSQLREKADLAELLAEMWTSLGSQ
jgi:hypothetical protein